MVSCRQSFMTSQRKCTASSYLTLFCWCLQSISPASHLLMQSHLFLCVLMLCKHSWLNEFVQMTDWINSAKSVTFFCLVMFLPGYWDDCHWGLGETDQDSSITPQNNRLEHKTGNEEALLAAVTCWIWAPSPVKPLPKNISLFPLQTLVCAHICLVHRKALKFVWLPVRLLHCYY